VVIADRQTAGRGRMRRAFFSPEGTGLYMSILLRPAVKAADSALITAAAAVAVAEALERLAGRSAQIKWVNDVFWMEKRSAAS
jgi:BirA family biotin operon repressor/biotin-[acetyl-CoA-carboxylase] ligase